MGLLPSLSEAEMSGMLKRLRTVSSRADLIGGDDMSETMARSMQGRARRLAARYWEKGAVFTGLEHLGQLPA
jgi:hypothetical protein